MGYRTPSSDPTVQIVQMALDGEFSSRGFKNALFSPQKLTPKEQEGIAQRIRNEHGQIAGALADTAMNPWVWLMFLTTPGAGRLLGRGGRAFAQNAKYLWWTKENHGWLAAAGMLHPGKILRGTAANSAVAQFTNVMEQLKIEEDAALAPLKKWIEKRGLRSRGLSPEKAAGAERDFLEKVNHAVIAKLSGFDVAQDVWLPVKKFKQKMANNPDYKIFRDSQGKVRSIFRKTRVEARVAQDALDDFIQKEGLGPVVASIRKSMDDRFGRLFTDAAGNVDAEKVGGIWRGLKHEMVRGGKLSGIKQVANVLGDDVLDAVANGQMSKQEFDNLIKFTFETQINKGTYFPRNLRQAFDGAGNKQTGEWLRERRAARAISSSGSAVPRVSAYEAYHPEDLQKMKGWFAGTAELDKQINRGLKRIAKRQAKNDPYTFLRMNVESSLTKHFNSTGRTYGMFVVSPNEEVRAVTKNMNDVYFKGTGQKLGVAPGAPVKEYARGIGLDENWIAHEAKGVAPVGGWKLADVMLDTYARMPNAYARKTLAELVVPSLMGQVGARRTVTAAALLQAKMGVNALADGPIGQMLDGMGKWGKAVRGELKRLGDPDVANLASSSLTASGMANTLYVTHLGLNLGSMVLNMTQPFLLASAGMGADNVLRGYKDALEEMFAYAGDRFRTYGLKPITMAQRIELVKRNFSMADVHGDDLAQFGLDVFESLDPALGGGVSSALRKHTRVKAMMNFMMKGFEKTEWLNRTVTAHAMKHVYRAKGAIDDVALNPLLRADIREMVQETQFGGNVMNLPVAFQTANPDLAKMGSLLSNPLMRQFLQFQWRSLYGALALPRELGGGVRRFAGMDVSNPTLVTALDFARGMGISAIMLNTANATLGIDLERAGFFQSTTDLVRGRFDAREQAFPLPPVLDIPRSAIMGFVEGDAHLIKQSTARLIPGGVGLGRLSSALGVGPLATRQVDWGNADQEGKYPVYDLQGRMVERVSPLRLALRGAGIPLDDDAQERSLNRSLMGNQEEVSYYRGEFIKAIRSGNVARANGVRREFERRFGAPLTVSQSRIQSALETEMTPRTARQAERISADLRRLYGPWLSGRAETPENAPPSLPSAQSFAPNPEAQAVLRAVQQAGGRSEQPTPRPPVFEPF